MASDDLGVDDVTESAGQDKGDTVDVTGLNGRSYPQHSELLKALPPNFREGIDALQRSNRCPGARVVTVSDDHHKGGAGFVFISLGVWPITRYADYDHECAEVFIRLKENFPNGKKYGFITDPVVKVDGEYPDGKTLPNRDIAEPLLEVLDVDEVLVWSRDWRHLGTGAPEDMRKATGWTRQVLREPFEED